MGIDGEANCEGWVPNPNDQSNNMGVGKDGSCCAEMDIWEANSMATAYTPHPCDLGNPGQKPAQYRCTGTDCGDNSAGERYQGVCDKDGCDINPYRMGNKSFYGRGPGFIIDTEKPMTVVTQFITSDGTDTGDLVEIRRFYKKEGKIIHSPPTTILGANAVDSITDEFCHDKKVLFEDVNMLWLDSAYPLDKPRTQPGVLRGDCPGGESSTPTYVRNQYPDGYVKFANAAIGEIGSTLLGSTGPFPTTPPPPCADGCSSKPGQNTPECNGQTKVRCQQMAQYENKCHWTECPVNPPSSSS